MDNYCGTHGLFELETGSHCPVCGVRLRRVDLRGEQLRDKLSRKKKRFVLSKSLPADRAGWDPEQRPLLRRLSRKEELAVLRRRKQFEYNRRMAEKQMQEEGFI